MSMKKIRRNKPVRRTLSENVESIAYSTPDSPLFDVEDNDVLGYVDQFLRNYSKMQPLEKTSLMTRDEALRALAVLEKAHTVVQSHLKTAKALKQLLNTRGEEAGESH
jgi:hypothetical protein